MSDFTPKLQQAREHVAIEWTDERSREVAAAMHKRRRRRHVRARALTIAASAAVVVLVVGLAWQRSSGRPIAALPGAAPAYDRTLRLNDGSTITPRDGSTAVVLRQVAPDRVELVLNAGSARLDVTGRADRVVTVDMRVARARPTEACSRWRWTVSARTFPWSKDVCASWGIDEAWLREGESGEFPSAPSVAASASTVPAGPAAASPMPSAHAPSAMTPPASSAWRAQARDGDFESAFQTLQTAGSAAVRDEPADLLLAADVARLSHHPSDAVEPLKRVVREHAADPRAALAAFTLGRVLLDELGRPAEAATAFVQARALGPGGPLEEDALAREVEGWSRAGDAEKAHGAAELYMSRYPEGRRIRAVRKFGEVE